MTRDSIGNFKIGIRCFFTVKILAQLHFADLRVGSSHLKNTCMTKLFYREGMVGPI